MYCVWVSFGPLIVSDVDENIALDDSCSMLLVRVSAPAPNALGSTNGVVHFAINFARAISPAIIGYDLSMHFL